MNVNKKLINNIDIKPSHNGKYGVSNLSCLYDVINQIPLSYYPTKSPLNELEKKSVNETNGFLQQISFLNSNDILIFL